MIFDGSVDENWQTAGGGFYLENALPVDFTSETNKNNPICICNEYREETAITASIDISYRENYSYFNQKGSFISRLWVKNTDIASVADFKTWLSNNPLQLVYLLANPITLSITSQDIPTLLGENNIFSNCGDVEVDYHADIGLYIDKKISSLAQA